MVFKVQNIDAESIHVEYNPTLSCHGCQICSTQKRTLTLPKQQNSPKPGDELILSLSRSQVFWLLVLAFLLPSVLALCGVILSYLLNLADPVPSLFGLAGIMVGWLFLAVFSHFHGRKFLPKISGVIPHE